MKKVINLTIGKPIDRHKMTILVNREMTQKRLDKTFDESAVGILKFYIPPAITIQKHKGGYLRILCSRNRIRNGFVCAE